MVGIMEYMILYDLPSENVIELKKERGESSKSADRKKKMRSLIARKRTLTTYYLYRIGIPITKSVILVPDSKADKIDSTIEKIKGIYKNVNEILKKEDFTPIGYPIIKKVPVAEMQIKDLKELAEIKLKQDLEKRIENMKELIEKFKESGQIKDKNEKKYDLGRRLWRLRNQEEMANEFGINAKEQFTKLAEMINQAIKVLETS